jgi:anti-sigma regulatory factor (Ser/Thr protein kinase)
VTLTRDVAGGPGVRHDLVVIDSDEQLRSVAAAFLDDGAAQDDVMRASLPGWLCDELRISHPHVTVGDNSRLRYRREPDQIAWIRKAAAEHAPRRLRFLSQVTAAGVRSWDERTRCEAITNLVYDGLGISVLCVYDRRTAPAAAVAMAGRTHPQLFTGGRRTANPSFVPPAELLDGLAVPDEPLTRTPPVLAVDAAPQLAGLRHALGEVLRGLGGDRDVEEDFHLAVSEIAANAFRHGRPPVSARLWASPDRLVCTITDSGTGYRDATAGYRPAHGEDLSSGGMGLWLARKLTDHVDLIRSPEGLTVRLATSLR